MFGSYIMFILGITLWLILNRTSIYENMSFCYDTIYDKVSLCYRSLQGYGKACFDNHYFAFIVSRSVFSVISAGDHQPMMVRHHLTKVVKSQQALV